MAENLKEAQEAPKAEATAPERTRETDFDVKLISPYVESFVKLVASTADTSDNMGDRDTRS